MNISSAVFAIGIAVINTVFVSWRAWIALRDRRLMAVIWILLTYFAALILFNSASGEFHYTLGFTAEQLFVSWVDLVRTNAFVLVANICFAVGDITGRGLFRNWRRPTARMVEVDRRYDFVLAIYVGLLIVGGVTYWLKTRGWDYQAYVEANESNWPQVVFFAASPGVVLSMLRRRWILAAAFVAAYTYFAVQFQVRSFFLISMCPAILWLAMTRLRTERLFNRRLVIRGTLAAAMLIVASAVITASRLGALQPGDLFLPEGDLPMYMQVAFHQIDRTGTTTGFDSLEHYWFGMARLAYRVSGDRAPTRPDPPVIVAQLVTGYTRARPDDQYLHYPSLWYTDAYLAFGWAGVSLGVLWGLVLTMSEHLTRRGLLSTATLLPFFCWHAYMLVRGAPAIASSTMALPVYAQVPLLGVAALMLTLAPTTRTMAPVRPGWTGAADMPTLCS
jgi:hypothetical protein